MAVYVDLWSGVISAQFEKSADEDVTNLACHKLFADVVQLWWIGSNSEKKNSQIGGVVCYFTDEKLGDELPTCCFLVDINIWCKIPGLYE